MAPLRCRVSGGRSAAEAPNRRLQTRLRPPLVRRPRRGRKRCAARSRSPYSDRGTCRPSGARQLPPSTRCAGAASPGSGRGSRSQAQCPPCRRRDDEVRGGQVAQRRAPPGWATSLHPPEVRLRSSATYSLRASPLSIRYSPRCNRIRRLTSCQSRRSCACRLFQHCSMAWPQERKSRGAPLLALRGRCQHDRSIERPNGAALRPVRGSLGPP